MPLFGRCLAAIWPLSLVLQNNEKKNKKKQVFHDGVVGFFL